MYLKSKSETNKRQCTAIKLLVKEIIGLNSCIKDLEVNTLSQLKERAIVQGVGVHPVAKESLVNNNDFYPPHSLHPSQTVYNYSYSFNFGGLPPSNNIQYDTGNVPN